MADSNPWLLPEGMSYASVDTALAASNVAYDNVYSGTEDTSADYEDLINSGWTQISNIQGENEPNFHYQGVAFYKVVNGVTEVIIANRGSQPGGGGPSFLYDYSTSDEDIRTGAAVPADNDAVAYYNNITTWLQLHVTGSVEILETGHSLGGQEADYIQAEITKGLLPASYTTETVTFDSPGLPETPAGLNEAGIDALNISLSTDPVHTLGADTNAGYGGQSVTVEGGIPAFLGSAMGDQGPTPGFEFSGGLLEFIIIGGNDHRLAQISAYIDAHPALGGVDLWTYQPDEITQGEVNQMGGTSAGDYDWKDPSELAAYYQGIFGSASGSGSSSSSGGTVGETFTSSETDSGLVLTGSEGDSITIAESDNATTGSDTINFTDSAGDNAVMTGSPDGTYIANDSWSNSQGTTGTDAYNGDGSSSGQIVYISGGYANYFSDGQGDVTWDYYSATGNLYAWNSIHSDGTSEAGAMLGNGLTLIPNSGSSFDVPAPYFETIQSPDGSYTVYTATQGDQIATSQFNESGTLTSSGITQGAGEDYNPSTATTTTTTDSSGTVYTEAQDASGDIVSKSWQYADSSSKTITYHESGATEEKDVNADASAQLIYTYGGDQTKNYYDSAGTLTEDTWALSDGTAGRDNFAADGTGSGTISYADGSTATMTIDSSLNITIDNESSSGRKTSEDWWRSDGTHGITIYNPDSSYSTYLYEVNGNTVETDYAADGSVALQTTVQSGAMFSPDGSAFGAITNSDGTRSVDYDNSNGDGFAFNVSAAGQLSSLVHVSAEPSSEWSIDLGNGQAAASPYSDLTPVFTGPDGTQYIEYTDASGTPTGEQWSAPGGNHGYVTVGADGSTSAITYNVDGTYYTVTSDGAGDSVTDFYEADSTLTADTWTGSDGSNGSDQYNADGSSSGTYYNADGSYLSYTDDGKGDITQFDYSSAGALVSSEWQKADGSYGNEVVNADGSIDGTQYQADGSYATFAVDAQGDNLTKNFAADSSLESQAWSFTNGSGSTITYNFDASGNLLQEAWKSADGDTDTVTGVSGTDLESSLSADRISGETIFGPPGGGVVQALGDQDSIYAAGGSNVMYALGASDYLLGSSGSDTLVALGANATLAGGSGNELFEVNDPTDVVEAESGAASNAIYSSVNYTLPENVGLLTLIGSANLVATGNSESANLITGNGGNDTLVGGSGSDTLVAGTGVDTFEAGDGDNTFVINDSDDVIQVGSSPGDDTVQSSVSYSLEQGIDVLELTGSANLEAYGNADAANLIEANSGNDTVYAGSGNDTLVAGSGSDLLQGGTGSATYVFDSGFGQTEIEPGTGGSTIEFGNGISLADLTVGLTQDTLGRPALLIQDGNSVVTIDGGLTGSIGAFEFANEPQLSLGEFLATATVLPGSVAGSTGYALLDSSAEASLAGGSGDDTVLGIGASDTLVAGVGDQYMFGAGSSDSLSGGAGADTLVGAGAADTIVAGNGSQQLYGLGEGDLLVGGTGDDTLYGGVGNDTLIASEGSTVMYGGQGSDTIVLTRGGSVTYYAGNGAGAEVIHLPPGMTIDDFTSYQDAEGDLVLQSTSGDTTAVISGFYNLTGKLWLLADDSGGLQSLATWAAGQHQTPSGYDQEVAELQQAFQASVLGGLNQLGAEGGSIQAPWTRASTDPRFQYHFTGVTTQTINVNVQTGALNIASSDDEQSTEAYQSETTIYDVSVPVFAAAAGAGARSFIPLDSQAGQFMADNPAVGGGNGDGLSVETGVDAAGDPGFWVTVSAPIEYQQTGTASEAETVLGGVYTSDTTQALIAYDVIGDGGNDIIQSNGPVVGTVDTGDGNVLVNLGLMNGFSVEFSNAYLQPVLGAFMQAGAGVDTLIGSGGSDVVAAGAGFDYILVGLGSSVYVPLQGASTDVIDTATPDWVGGVSPYNTLVLPSGITPEDLQFKLFTDATSATNQMYANAFVSTGDSYNAHNYKEEEDSSLFGSLKDTLQIKYGDSTVLLDFIPSPPGYGGPDDLYNGINRLQFSDGTVLTRDQILALTGPAVSASNLSPAVTGLNPTVNADSPMAGTSLFSGSDDSGFSISWYQITDSGAGGAHFVLNGVAQSAGQAFYVSEDQLSGLIYESGDADTSDSVQISAFDGVVWGNSTSFNVLPSTSAYQCEASGPDQSVSGPPTGPDTLAGGYGGDTLIGSSGEDTFEYNAGSGAEVISETVPVSSVSDNVVQFGSGISPSSISLSESGDPQLVLTMGSGGDSLTIDGFDPLNPLQSFPIQSFAFADGTTLSLSQLLADGDVTGSSGSITNGDGSVTDYEFTPSGPQIYYAQTTDSAGQETQSVLLSADGSGEADTFNAQGQRTDVEYTHSNGSTDDYAYTFNANGTLSGITEVSTPPGGGGTTTTVSSYDGSGNEVSQQVTNPDGSQEYDTYNAQGQQTGVDYTHVDGSTDDYSYTFNANGALSSTTEVSTPTGGGGSTTTVYGYDASGNEVSKQVTYPDGSGESDTYNAEGQRLGVNYTSADGSMNDWTYTYSADGTLSGATEVSTPAGGGAATTFVYAYDSDGNQISENDYTPSADGSYTDTWTDADGSHGSYWWNSSTSEYKETWYDSDGSNWTDDYQYSSGGSPGTTGYSYVETYGGSDGSQGTRQFDASTGSVSLTWYSAATGSLSGTIADSGFIGLQNDGELTNTQQDLTFFNPNVSPGFNAFLAAH